MALQKDTITLNLAKTINDKTSEKIAKPDQLAVLRDARFTKDLELEKRKGMTGQSLSFQGDPGFISPVAIAATNLKSKVFAHENQLCLANNGNLFSQYEGQNKWIFKGTYKPIGITAKQLNASVVFSDVGHSSGVTVAISPGSSAIYVYEEATGNLISSTTTADVPRRVIAFSGAIFVLTTTGANIYYRQINLSTGAVGSNVSIKSDNSNSGNIYAAVTSGSALGEVAFILYFSSSSSTWKAFPMDTSGSLPAIGAKTTGLTSNTVAGIVIEPSVSPNKFYVGSPDHIEAYTFTSGAYSTVYSTSWTPTVQSSAASLTNSGSSYLHFTMALSPVNNTDIYAYLDVSPLLVGGASATSSPTNQFFTDDCAVNQISISAAGAVNFNSVYGYGYVLAGQAIRDTNLKSIYIPAQYISELQSSILIFDTLSGNSAKFSYPFGKCLYGLATGGLSPGTSTVSTIAAFTSSSANISTGIYRITNSSYFVDFNFSPTYAPQTQYFANTTHFTGGFLWAYDGQTMAEHNFLIQPENFKVSTGQAAAAAAVTVVGDASHKETVTFTVKAAQFFNISNKVSPFISNSLQFSTTAANYYLWGTVDGVGTDPAIGGRTAIGPVALLGTDTDEDVAGKFAMAVNAAGILAAASCAGNIVTIQNAANGAVTAPTVGGSNVTGVLSAGSYGYCFAYKWTDRNGQVYRSAPSVPVTVTASANDATVLNVWAPPLTNKGFSNVFVEVYRTSANGSEYQLLTTIGTASSPATMSSSGSRVWFLDSSESDAQLADNPLLYTDGGILENFSIPACSTISFFKDRLTCNSVDDKFAVYYSKTNVKGEPVNFTAEGFFRVDAEASAVSAIAALDDKMCIFKRPLVYVVSGDGADDLGNNSTLSPPMKIATDVGALNPNSIALYPNGLLFKSDKGIYALNRSLGVQYVGNPVESLNAFTVSGGQLMESTTEVRFTLSDSSTSLVYNYFFDRWDTFTNSQADSSCIWQNTYCYVANSGRVFIESATDYYDYDGSSNVSYSMYLKTPWLKLKGVQDFQRIWRLSLLGGYVSPHTLTVNIYYDFDPTLYAGNTYTFTGADLIAGTFPGDPVYQAQIIPNVQKCQSLMLEIYETPISGTQASCTLNELGATVGMKTGLAKIPARKVQ